MLPPRCAAKNGPRVRKCSTRDIASTLASGPEALGATTVAATMAVAHAAGISVFATGRVHPTASALCLVPMVFHMNAHRRP
ncbi:hypothetical protein EON66_03920 [archaeon]|nr:MAG: hypothetical protein EON66_03920 [archaeon]